LFATDAASLWRVLKPAAEPAPSEEQEPADKRRRSGAGSSVDSTEQFKLRILAVDNTHEMFLRALSIEWWPKWELKQGQKNYNVMASCGSGLTIRMQMMCLTLTHSCAGAAEHVIEKPRSFSFKKQAKSEWSSFLYECAGKCCGCGRSVWNPFCA